MSRRIFISALGDGDYQPVEYRLAEGHHCSEFIQVAELKLLGSFDQRHILVTPTSRKKHGAELERQADGLALDLVDIPEDLDAAAQWQTFETVLRLVQEGDRVVFDFTHGFRLVPIVLSAALEFVRRARRATVERVLYGAYVKGQTTAEVIDLTGFYEIAAWTDGVARLIDDADARTLAELGAQDQAGRFAALAAPELRDALVALTRGLRNAEAPRVDRYARQALERVNASREDADLPSEVLLDLVASKFAKLAETGSTGGRLDRGYFECQTVLARLLVDHRLLMQALTVMDEHVASLGALPNAKAGISSNNRLGERKRWGEVFIQMVARERETWAFTGDAERRKTRLLPWYDALNDAGVIEGLRAFVPELRDVRNNFNHAWHTKQGGPEAGLTEQVTGWVDQLKRLTTTALDIAETFLAESVPPESTGLLNLSNHPLSTWPDAQRSAAEEEFGSVRDQPGGFPRVPPDATEKAVRALAEQTVDAVLADPPAAVFVVGEHRLTAILVARLQAKQIRCVTATAERDADAEPQPDGAVRRTATYRFVRWADYPALV